MTDKDGKLNKSERSEADKDHKQREDMPASAFLEGESRKYPVKSKQDGEWEYDSDLLLAAEKEAEMHGHADLAAKARRIRDHQFPAAHDAFAFDRASVRRIDVDGRLHVSLTNISKATVNPYYGREIPGWQQLGLKADLIYNLFRDPAELEKSASTFNNIPLMSRHVAVSADDPQKMDVIGATGSDAQYNAPYLQNSLVIWDSSAIAGVETREQQEISCAYRYVPDMTPGAFEGIPYDGIMTQIVGNHVALVPDGRAGPDVVVSDHNPFTESQTMKKANGKTIAVRAAVRAYLRPVLATDAALDIKPLIGQIKSLTEADAKRLALAIKVNAKLANDADISDLHKVIFDAAESEEDDVAEDEEEETEEEKKAREEKEAKEKAEDEDEEEAKKDDDKKAMDAAIAKAQTETIKRMRDVQQAEREVKPLVGEVIAMDSAEDVYKLALDQAGVDVSGVHPSAYRVIVTQLLSAKNAKPNLANDAATATTFWSDFKGIKLPTRV